MPGLKCLKLFSIALFVLIPRASAFATTRTTAIGGSSELLSIQRTNHRSVFYHPVTRADTRLYNKKKKVAPAATKKIQVKMLKYVEGTGHVGEVVMVTPAYYNNKLRPTSSAIVITDEEIEREKSKAEAMEKEINERAEAVKEKLSDFTMIIQRKAGPNGHLFGAISQKNILSELNELIKDDYLHSKGVKITGLVDADGKKLQTDIKNLGEYEATLSLTKDKAIKFKVIIEAENEK
jgi:large subunit ribosomal protein L9